MLSKKPIQKSIILIISVIVVSAEPIILIDGVTAATTITPTTPPPPVLHVLASPPIVNNIIRAREGQPISIQLSGSDKNGYLTLHVGIVQNGNLYNDQSNLSLPPGASFSLNYGDPTQATLTWTPPVGTSSKTPLIAFKFGVLNTYWNTSTTQTITIKTDDNLAPSFDGASIPTQQTAVAGTLLQIPITTLPDADNDAVTISAQALPAGAKLSKAVKNAKGHWVSTLSWTPRISQIGTNTITFTAQDDVLNPAQTTYPVAFVVNDMTVPSFDASMPKTQKAVVNKKLSFKVIVNPDPHNQYVTISGTDLPPGASLGKPSKVKNQWVSTLTWKPDASQLGSQFLVKFLAQDNVSNAVSVTSDVIFNVSSK